GGTQSPTFARARSCELRRAGAEPAEKTTQRGTRRDDSAEDARRRPAKPAANETKSVPQTRATYVSRLAFVRRFSFRRPASRAVARRVCVLCGLCGLCVRSVV